MTAQFVSQIIISYNFSIFNIVNILLKLIKIHHDNNQYHDSIKS
jgi:hypothetical protein